MLGGCPRKSWQAPVCHLAWPLAPVARLTSRHSAAMAQGWVAEYGLGLPTYSLPGVRNGMVRMKLVPTSGADTTFSLPDHGVPADVTQVAAAE